MNYSGYEELNEYTKSLKSWANRLPDKYENYDITELANKYCEAVDNNDEVNKNIYYSALLLRFWYLISKTCEKNKTLNLEPQIFCDKLQEAILNSCAEENRAWQKNPKLTAQQVINQTFNTRGVAALYYEANLQKNVGKRLETSIDDPISGEDDEKTTVGAMIDSEDHSHADCDIKNLIQHYIDNNKVVEAIIFDTIVNRDVFQRDKRVVKTTDAAGNAYKYTNTTTEFKPSKLVQELNHIDVNYVNYFLRTYDISVPMLDAAISAINRANNQKLYKMLANSIADLKATSGLV